jgi:hypothetical protein
MDSRRKGFVECFVGAFILGVTFALILIAIVYGSYLQDCSTYPCSAFAGENYFFDFILLIVGAMLSLRGWTDIVKKPKTPM